MAKKVCKYCAKTYSSEVMMQRPICRDCFNAGAHLPKQEPKQTATIYKDKSISRLGWFWKEGWDDGYAFTKRGAVRQAKRNAKRKKLGISNSFKVEV